MQNSTEFNQRRRQAYLVEESYHNTIAQLEAEIAVPITPGLSPENFAGDLDLIASTKWFIFKLKFTAGEDLAALAESLEDIVAAYERYVEALDDVSDDKYYPPFVMNDLIDTYVDYLDLVSVAILLRREDLVERIWALNEGTDFDGVDAVLEELFKFYLPDRPNLDQWLWNKPYRKLLDAIDSDNAPEMQAEMKLYVEGWYRSMKGRALFWNHHERTKPEFTSYKGYWAMCAAAFTYLYNIDDTSYREEMVYPKDLVDYARSKPRTARLNTLAPSRSKA